MSIQGISKELASLSFYTSFASTFEEDTNMNPEPEPCNLRACRNANEFPTALKPNCRTKRRRHACFMTSVAQFNFTARRRFVLLPPLFCLFCHRTTLIHPRGCVARPPSVTQPYNVSDVSPSAVTQTPANVKTGVALKFDLSILYAAQV